MEDRPFIGGSFSTPTFEGRKVEDRAPSSSRTSAKDRLHFALLQSTEWSSVPAVEDQEYEFEGTMRVAGVEVDEFSVSDQDHKKRLEAILLSNKLRRSKILMREPEYRYNEKDGRWTVLVVVMVREFKTLPDSKRKELEEQEKADKRKAEEAAVEKEADEEKADEPEKEGDSEES